MATSNKDQKSDPAKPNWLTPDAYLNASVSAISTRQTKSESKEKSAKPINGLVDQSNDPKDSTHDSLNLLPFILMRQFAEENADGDDTVESFRLSKIIDAFDRVGFDTSSIKSTIASVSGKSYEEFAAAANSDHFSRISVASYFGGRSQSADKFGSTGHFDSSRAIRLSQNDDAGSGNCARGTANVLTEMGYNVQRGHATDWDKLLSKQGWKKIDVDPAHAPVGAVLVFNSDKDSGKAECNNGRGRQYGHVEIVVEGGFVSDKLRTNAGGSVPNNRYTAFVPPGVSLEANMAHNTAPVARHHTAPSLEHI